MLKLFFQLFTLRFPPKDFKSQDVLNRGNRVLLMTIDPKFSTINAVEQLAEILKKECQKTIIVLGAKGRQ